MRPAVARTIAEARAAVALAHQQGRKVGLVPTMGALHAGHASLCRAARSESDLVAVSIYVNPTQFAPSEDLARYPRTWEADVLVCEREGVDLIYAPDNETMYPAGFQTYVEVSQLQMGLCGRSRPNHFRGVATVVLKLFNIIQPNMAYFGQKDAQQCRIIQQMTRDLDIPVEIRVCPIIREADGLALSSRNKYLDAAQRQQATVLFQALTDAKRRVDGGERAAGNIRAAMVAMIEATPGAVVDYVELVSADTLEPIRCLKGRVLIALAVKLGNTRLIDNLVLEAIA